MERLEQHRSADVREKLPVTPALVFCAKSIKVKFKIRYFDIF